MPRVHLLPPGLVNQIAAGEVVERPASVVKELVENALDAGATSVVVDVEEGGLALVRVADDGCGMDAEDARMALERHATSKLADPAGLAAIATLGFRGEAIPAIASVSRFRLHTAPAEDGAGTRLEVEGGRILAAEEAARARGTTVEVRDLFFNTPARRKFMKAGPTEAGHVTEAVIRLALASPDVSFTLRSSGRTVLSARAGEPAADRVALALGREAHAHLIPVDAARGQVRVRGFVCGPDHSQATGRSLYLFVNGRYVRDRSAAHAVLRAYAGTLPPGRHPAGVLLIDLPLDRVDVNVHPQKLEVRFADAREVQDALFHAISSVLRTAPWLRTSPPGAREGAPAPGAPPDALAVPVAGEDVASVLAWARSSRLAGGAAVALQAVGTELAEVGVPWTREPGLAFPVAGEDGPRAGGYFASLRYIGQHARTYLVCEAPGGALVLVDQHASHERLLFQRLREAWSARRLPVQPLLIPRVVTVPPATARALEGAVQDLAQVGLEIEPFGGDAFAVKGAPAALGGVDLEALLVDLAAQLEHLDRASALDDAFHDLIATMACHSAIRAHQDVGPEEARALLDGLDGIDFKARCPHGRPVVFEMPLADLERRVGRR